MKVEFAVLAIGLGVAVVAPASAQQQQQARDWRVNVQKLSGTACPDGALLWVREGNGKLTMLSADKRTELWSVVQAPNGSVNAQAYNPATKTTALVQAPAGTEPRSFEYLSGPCAYRVTPAK